MSYDVFLQKIRHFVRLSTSTRWYGFARKSAYPLHYNHIKGAYPHILLVWPVGLGTSMTRDMSGFHDSHIILKFAAKYGYYLSKVFV